MVTNEDRQDNTVVVVMAVVMVMVLVTVMVTQMVLWGRIVMEVMVVDRTLDCIMTASAEEARHTVAGMW